MILPAQAIRSKAIIFPFAERTRHDESGMTFGLSPAGYDVCIREDVYLPPQSFVLASIVEHMTMPDDVLATVHDKSSWARLGLAVQTTVVEPGWRGVLTVELSNHGRVSLKIGAGWPIAQILFHQLTEPTEQPYAGRYQDQKAGPQPALINGGVSERSRLPEAVAGAAA